MMPAYGRPLTAMNNDQVPNVSARRVLARATHVFGSRRQAEQWLMTPNPALDDVTPASLLDTLDGVREVLGFLEICEMLGGLADD